MIKGINKKRICKDFDTSVSENRSAIMGLAMLSVMLFHQYFTSVFPFNAFHNFGYWGVDVFLFLSGMGLVRSLGNNSIRIYYLRRFKRILPSCVLCGSVKYLVFLLLGSSVAILKEGLNLGWWSLASLDSWFIHTILVLYAISPLLYFMLRKWALTTFTIIVIALFINGLTIRPLIGFDWTSPLGVLSYTIERTPVFATGMLVSIKGVWINNKMQYSVLFLIVAVGIKLLAKYGLSLYGSQAFINFALTLGMPALVIANIYLIRILPKLIHKSIIFMGNCSLELYLVHGFIFWSLKTVYPVVSPWLLLPTGFLLSFSSAYLCKKFIKKFIS